MADFSGVTNPKRVIEKRLETAEGTKPSPSATIPPGNQRQFLRGYSPEEKARQNMELAKLLAKRK